MDQRAFKVFLFIACFAAGIYLVISGLFWTAVEGLAQFFGVLMPTKKEEIGMILGVFVLMVLSTILLLTPVGSIAYPFLAQIIYKLLVNDKALFYMPVLNGVLCLLCVCVAAYGLFMQFKWMSTEDKSYNEKDISRLI
ncbi:MAG: hypothetical protein HGA85_04230 [Nanoarchaeota archaeon]|nr:hypothetical protein [Nanoarchaeota archaeon]